MQLFVSSSKRAKHFFDKINDIIKDANLMKTSKETNSNIKIDNSIDINEKKESISRLVSLLQSINN